MLALRATPAATRNASSLGVPLNYIPEDVLDERELRLEQEHRYRVPARVRHPQVPA